MSERYIPTAKDLVQLAHDLRDFAGPISTPRAKEKIYEENWVPLSGWTIAQSIKNGDIPKVKEFLIIMDGRAFS